MATVIDLSGSTALVTGSNQGIGAAIARVLHGSGARVVVNHPDSPDGKTREDAQALVDRLNRDRAEECDRAGRRRERSRRRAGDDGASRGSNGAGSTSWSTTRASSAIVRSPR